MCRPKMKEINNKRRQNSESESEKLTRKQLKSDKKIAKLKRKQAKTDKTSEKEDENNGNRSLSVNEMIKQEKTNSNEQYDSFMMGILSKKGGKIQDSDALDDMVDEAPIHNTFDVKKQFDFKNIQAHQNVLDNCSFCYTPEQVPLVSIAALGNKTYLALPETLDLVPGHCLIIPTQHVTSSLECEDDVWDEIKVFLLLLLFLT